MTNPNVKDFCGSIISETSKIMIGKEYQTRLIITAILSGGHILLEDMPGSGKTTLVKCISSAMDMMFKRIQFTPDLLPSDITGMNIFDQSTGGFRFIEGPVQTNILLADEINRAIPRTQSALLEAMEEKQVTVDGKSTPLPNPFVVLATQNPVDSENTFPLPQAQMDRFFMKLSLGYPTPEEEVRMITELGSGIPFERIKAVITPDQIADLAAECDSAFISEDLKAYIVNIVAATRNHPSIKTGASPRASRSMFTGAKAYAKTFGRDFVTPEDITALAPYVLSHRITLSNEARFSGKKPEKVIASILESVPVPPFKENMLHGE